ncbi:hypothetical protein BH23BAC4_BH23BAC4_09560 [soil metagenome]
MEELEGVYTIIAITFFGFIALAFILLFPVWRFLRKEERHSEEWTPDAIARAQRRQRSLGNGAGGSPEVKTPRK